MVIIQSGTVLRYGCCAVLGIHLYLASAPQFIITRTLLLGDMLPFISWPTNISESSAVPPSNARVHAFMDVLSTHRIVDFPHTMSQIHDTKKTTHCHSQERSVQFLLNFDNPPLTPTERNLQVQSTRTFEKYISWTLSTNSSSKNSKFGESF